MTCAEAARSHKDATLASRPRDIQHANVLSEPSRWLQAKSADHARSMDDASPGLWVRLEVVEVVSCLFDECLHCLTLLGHALLVGRAVHRKPDTHRTRLRTLQAS